METTKEDGYTMQSTKFKDIHILNIIKDLQTKYSSAKNANDQSMAEISRLELENIEFRKELRLCKEYVREVDKIREHEGNSTVLLTDQECHDFTQYKEQYNYRINQTMIMHNMWPTEPIDETSQEQNADDDQDFLSILNENDTLKREI